MAGQYGSYLVFGCVPKTTTAIGIAAQVGPIWPFAGHSDRAVAPSPLDFPQNCNRRTERRYAHCEFGARSRHGH